MPKPIIAIVGRPNVGKSALFNRLARQRLSIVEDTPGVTRDRVYADCDIYERDCTLVDTGGLDPSERSGLVPQVAAQAKVAITEAAVILLVADAKVPLTATDFQVGDLLRATHKPVLLIANKMDKSETPPEDLFALRLGEPVGVSAIHGLNIDEVVDWIAGALPPTPPEEEVQDDSIKIAIVGRPNVGKSALLNALTRQERSIVSDIPGTTRDAIDTPWEWRGQAITLIDTAGMRKRGKVKLTLEYYCVLRSLRAIERAEVVFLMIDNEGPMEQDAKIGGYANEAGKAMVIVANKWDLLRKALYEDNLDERTRSRHQGLLRTDFSRSVRSQLSFMQYAPVVFTSATEGKGFKELMETALSVHEQNTRRIPTGQLNRLVSDAVLDKPLSLHKGKRVKLYYATQSGTEPPTFVLFCNYPESVHFSYVRYLENRIRKAFGFDGTPLRLVLKARERSRE